VTLVHREYHCDNGISRENSTPLSEDSAGSEQAKVPGSREHRKFLYHLSAAEYTSSGKIQKLCKIPKDGITNT